MVAAVLPGTPICISVAAQIPPASELKQQRLAKHSERFQYYSSARRAETAKPNAENIIDLSQDLLNDYADDRGISTPQQELHRLSQSVGAIILGTATERESALNPQHSFVGR